jgi:hypothetical protein
VEFVTIIGPNLPSAITINELTTVAAGYSMAQFYKSGVISGNSFGLRIAADMNDNIVMSDTGQSSPVLLLSPNADQSNSLRSTRSLANLLAACVHDIGNTIAFFGLTTPPEGPVPRSTTQAMANLARDPGQNVQSIYGLTTLRNSYEPGLLSMPDAWTVTVKVNDSGNDDFLFAGPGNIAFDSRGYAWIANNVEQGKTTSCKFAIVLQPNGMPSDGTNGTPLSPIMGGGILGPGFGVTVDPKGSIWFGNFGWGRDNPSRLGNGSVSQFTASGIPISGPKGYQGGPVRVQATVSDANGNIWFASFGNDSVYVFLDGDRHRSTGVPQYKGSGPFGIAIAADGTAWATNSGGFFGKHPSSIAKFAIVNGVLERQSLQFFGKALKAVAVDSQGTFGSLPRVTALCTHFIPTAPRSVGSTGEASTDRGVWRLTVRTTYGSRISVPSSPAAISRPAGLRSFAALIPPPDPLVKMRAIRFHPRPVTPCFPPVARCCCTMEIRCTVRAVHPVSPQ